MTNPTGPWVYFFAGADKKSLFEKVQSLSAQVDHYEVLEIISVCGRSQVNVEPKWHMLRAEAATPFSSDTDVQFKGATRHLQYTTDALRSELQKKSATPYPASESTLAVLIPIGKSEAWWSLSQDARQKHFEKTSGARNHSGIGYDYADKIYRKLYHSRYLETQKPLNYDFLTYFEFHEKDKDLFKSLLRELRNTEINPEWKFVEKETEIWMVKNER